MSEIVFLYMTAPNADVAARIAGALIEEKHAACVNIHGEMRSLYEWGGKTEMQLETPMIVKTTVAAADGARARILALHPHDVPCITALVVNNDISHAPFLDWVRAQTSAKPD